MTEETLFELALNTPAADRAALLDRECAGDAALRGRVEALLAAHDRLELGPPLPSPDRPTLAMEPGSPAGSPEDATSPPDMAGATWRPTEDHRPAEGVGSVLAGRYKLVEEIGEGGMGAVFLAQQTAPVRRTVAIKVIKAGMDTRAVLARFDAERQALALMDHPNIARVLDAGTTDSGRPFFVMELVKGTPITRFCDERRLTPRQRLELFVPVCQAIQHAHQKGVIHRDIKPSNVLVSLYDDHPVPKVIDFGVAKAAGSSLTEQTLVTGFGTVVGTPEYMSPEQATLNNLDVNTRSDVYALGVLLYELLTGTTPVDRRSLGRAAVLEVLRIVREVEAPTPSSRLSTLEGLPSIAASRSIEPSRLSGMLRGELDWIAMKALEKDRSRRYETANALARDVQRYLADEVVEARPPSAGYRLRKFARRHRGRVVAASLVLLALVVGIVGTSFGLVRAEQRRREAEAANARARERLAQLQKGNEILAAIFDDMDVRGVREDGRPLEAILADRLLVAADQLEGQSVGDPLAVAALQDRLAVALLSLRYASKAILVLMKARATREALLGADHPDTLETLSHLQEGYWQIGKLDLALPLAERVLRVRKAQLGPDHLDTLGAMYAVGLVHWSAGKYELARTLLDEVVRSAKVRPGPDDPDTLTYMQGLAQVYEDAGHPDLALPLREEVLRLSKARLGPEHNSTLLAMAVLSRSYTDAGKLDLALPLAEEALRVRMARFGPDHPGTLSLMDVMGSTYCRARQLDRGIPLLEEAARRMKEKLGPDHPETLTAMSNLAGAYAEADRPGAALPLAEEVLRTKRARLGPDHPKTLGAANNLGSIYNRAEKHDAAARLLEETLRAMKARLGPDHQGTLAAMENLAESYRDLGRLDRAIPLFEETLSRVKVGLGPDHPRTLRLMRKLAKAHLKARQFDRALPLAEETLRLCRARPGGDHVETTEAMVTLRRPTWSPVDPTGRSRWPRRRCGCAGPGRAAIPRRSRPSSCSPRPIGGSGSMHWPCRSRRRSWS